MTRTLSTNIYPRSEHCLQTASDWWEGSEQPILRLAHDADVFSIWQNAFMIVTMSLLKVLTDSPEPEIDVSCWPELLFQVMQRCRQNTLQPADLISLNFSFKRCVFNSWQRENPNRGLFPDFLVMTRTMEVTWQQSTHVSEFLHRSNPRVWSSISSLLVIVMTFPLQHVSKHDWLLVKPGETSNTDQALMENKLLWVTSSEVVQTWLTKAASWNRPLICLHNRQFPCVMW